MPVFKIPKDDNSQIDLTKEFVNEHFMDILKDAVDEGFEGDLTEYIKEHAPKKFDKIFQDDTMAKIFGAMGQQAIEEAAEAGKDISDIEFFGAGLSDGDPSNIEPALFAARTEVLGRYYISAIDVLRANRELEEECREKMKKLFPEKLKDFNNRAEELREVMKAFCADVWDLTPDIIEHDVRAMGFILTSKELDDLLND